MIKKYFEITVKNKDLGKLSFYFYLLSRDFVLQIKSSRN